MNEQQQTVPVLQDLSDAAISRAIEASLTAFPVNVARSLGGEISNTADLLWITIAIPLDSLNGVFRSIFTPSNADAYIEAMITEFHQRNLPMCWQLGPSSQPSDLGKRLLAHGFKHDEDEPGMALDILTMNEDFPAPAELVIQPVRDLPTLRQWVNIWLFGAPDNVTAIYQDVHARLGIGPHLPWHYFIGLYNGKPVATSCLFLAAGVAAVHTVVTLPEVRNRGIGAAMTLAALREARQRGYRYAILTASPYGERIYRRIGFRDYCTISRYSLQIGQPESAQEE